MLLEPRGLQGVKEPKESARRSMRLSIPVDHQVFLFIIKLQIESNLDIRNHALTRLVKHPQ